MSVLNRWQQPSAQRQVAQVSFRPAQHVMAKLNVVKAMFNRNMTECINDLLIDALERLEEDLKGPREEDWPQNHPDYDPYAERDYADLSRYNDYMAKVAAEMKALESKVSSEE